MNWRKALLYGAAGLFALGIVNALYQANAYASEVPDIAQATFKMYKGDTGACSMTLVKNEPGDVLFLSAGHCTWSGTTGLNIRIQKFEADLQTITSEQVVYLKAVRTIKSKDVVLLTPMDKDIRIAGTPIDVATVEEANKLRIGDRLMVAGFPAATVLSITDGTFAGKVAQVFRELDSKTPMYQTTVPVAGGNSGGGLYAQFDGKWKLIGTVTGKRTDNDVMSWMQTAETVNEILRGFVTEGSKRPAIDKNAIRQSPLNIDQR